MIGFSRNILYLRSRFLFRQSVLRCSDQTCQVILCSNLPFRRKVSNNNNINNKKSNKTTTRTTTGIGKLFHPIFSFSRETRSTVMSTGLSQIQGLGGTILAIGAPAEKRRSWLLNEHIFVQTYLFTGFFESYSLSRFYFWHSTLRTFRNSNLEWLQPRDVCWTASANENWLFSPINVDDYKLRETAKRLPMTDGSSNAPFWLPYMNTKRHVQQYNHPCPMECWSVCIERTEEKQLMQWSL